MFLTCKTSTPIVSSLNAYANEGLLMLSLLLLLLLQRDRAVCRLGQRMS